MGKYKINVTVNRVECDSETDDSPIELELEDGYQFTINENAGESIDDCEAALLKTAFPAIRKALPRHMEGVSKKILNQANAEQFEVNKHPYLVDRAVGRFKFKTHSAFGSNNVLLDSSQLVFTPLNLKQFYLTSGFKELAMIMGDTEASFRKTSKLINHIRYQPKNGTPSRTLHDQTQKEGTELFDHVVVAWPHK